MSSFWDSSWNGPLSSDELFVSFWQLVRKNNTKREHTHRNTKDFFVFFFENVLFVEFVVVTGYLVGHYWNKNILSLRFPALLTGRCIILWVCRKRLSSDLLRCFNVGCFQEQDYNEEKEFQVCAKSFGIEFSGNKKFWLIWNCSFACQTIYFFALMIYNLSFSLKNKWHFFSRRLPYSVHLQEITK